MVSRGVLGVFSFSLGATILMIIIRYMQINPYLGYGSLRVDWTALSWLGLFGFFSFALIGFGILLIVKDARTEKSPTQQ